MLGTAGGIDPKENLLVAPFPCVWAGFEPGFGVSHAAHFTLSGSLRTIHVSHSHLFEPASLNALPKLPKFVALVLLLGLAELIRLGSCCLPSTSKQLPVFNVGTTTGAFSASKQLPLFSGRTVFSDGTASVVVPLGATLTFGLAISGLNWNPVSIGATVL